MMIPSTTPTNGGREPPGGPPGGSRPPFAGRSSTHVDQHNGLAGDGLGTADVSDLFSRLRLDVDTIFVDAKLLRQTATDRGLDRTELRLLSEDRHIQVDNAPAVAVQPRQRFAEEEARITVAPGGIGVGVGVADVAKARGA